MFPGNHCLLSIWYTDPPFRVHHHARRIMEFEWENEHDDSGSKLLTLTVTYQADGNYLIEVIPPLFASLVMFKGSFISLFFFFSLPQTRIASLRNPSNFVYAYADGRRWFVYFRSQSNISRRA